MHLFPFLTSLPHQFFHIWRTSPLFNDHLKSVKAGRVVFDDQDVVLDGEKISVAGEQARKVERFLNIDL